MPSVELDAAAFPAPERFRAERVRAIGPTAERFRRVSEEVWRASRRLRISYILRPVKIYTRTGDDGETSLFGKLRVSKSDRRVDAYGDVDELNSWLGLVRSHGLDPDSDEVLGQLQRDLFAVGAQLADPTEHLSDRVTKAFVTDEDVTRLEHTIDRLDSELPPLTS